MFEFFVENWKSLVPTAAILAIINKYFSDFIKSVPGKITDYLRGVPDFRVDGIWISRFDSKFKEKKNIEIYFIRESNGGKLRIVYYQFNSKNDNVPKYIAIGIRKLTNICIIYYNSIKTSDQGGVMLLSPQNDESGLSYLSGHYSEFDNRHGVGRGEILTNNINMYRVILPMFHRAMLNIGVTRFINYNTVGRLGVLKNLDLK